MFRPLTRFSFTLIGLVLLLGLFASGCQAAGKPVVQPPQSRWQVQPILAESWQFYKDRFLINGERVESNNYGGTISEGQSYALLKAVWMEDPATFQRVWSWTRREMRRPHDALLGWRWGERENGTSGLIEVENATDADQDIAYALLLAGERWGRTEYIRDARRIIADLWRLDVAEIGGRHYLVPGTWEGFRQEYLSLNPSYMAPYVYRKFAQYDTTNAAGWTALADQTYDVLEACADLTRPGLPPNWCAVPWDAQPGTLPIMFSDRQGEGARDFSYDAFRVFWRMAMDARLSPAPGRARAQAFLQKHRHLLTYWEQHQSLPEGFAPDGQPIGDPPTSGFSLSAALAQSHVLDPSRDAGLYQAMLAPHYHPEGYWFNDYNDFLHSVIWLHLYTLTL